VVTHALGVQHIPFVPRTVMLWFRLRLRLRLQQLLLLLRVRRTSGTKPGCTQPLPNCGAVLLQRRHLEGTSHACS
jgi:hypothetical protein